MCVRDVCVYGIEWYLGIADAHLGRLVVDTGGRLAREQLGEEVVERGAQSQAADHNHGRVARVRGCLFRCVSCASSSQITFKQINKSHILDPGTFFFYRPHKHAHTHEN